MGNIVDTLQQHRLVGFDSPVFIYHIERVLPWAIAAGHALDGLEDGVYGGLTSVLTLMEISVKPLRLQRPEIAAEYSILVEEIDHLAIVDIDGRVSRHAAELRATYGVRTPDALQLACCLVHGATAFLTNDHRLRHVLELDVIILDDFVAESPIR